MNFGNKTSKIIWHFYWSCDGIRWDEEEYEDDDEHEMMKKYAADEQLTLNGFCTWAVEWGGPFSSELIIINPE